MKTRNGFVSNSSSSSFIIRGQKRVWVPHPDGTPYRVMETHEPVIDNHQEKLLSDFGFMKDTLFDIDEYIYDIVCNEDCVIKFLITNKIPFEAHCHYDQVYYFWDGKNENVISFTNHGSEYAMYGDFLNKFNDIDSIEKLFKRTAGKYISTKTFTDCTCDNQRLCEEGGLL